MYAGRDDGSRGAPHRQAADQDACNQRCVVLAALATVVATFVLLIWDSVDAGAEGVVGCARCNASCGTEGACVACLNCTCFCVSHDDGGMVSM